MARNPSVNQPFVNPQSGLITEAWLRFLMSLGSASNAEGVVQIDHGGTGAIDTHSARANLGLGALATQNTIDLAGQATGNLAITHLAGGTGASVSTFWRGDGSWGVPLSTPPGGTPGQIQFNNAGSFGGFTVGGDGSLNTGTGALIVTKTNGVSFAPIATSGSASDLGTGTLSLARFGTQTARFVLAGPPSGGADVPAFRQLHAADLADGTTGTGNVVLSDAPTFTGLIQGASLTLSSTLTAATVNATNITGTAINGTVGAFTSLTVSGATSAANITNTTNTSQLHLSGTGNDDGAYFLGEGVSDCYAIGGATHIGGAWTAKATAATILAISGPSGFVLFSNSGLTAGNTYTPTNRFQVDQTGTMLAGTVPVARVSGLAAVATSGSAGDLGSGTLPAARLPNPSSTTLGGVQSKAAVASNWLTSISTSGVPAASQPAFSDISGTASATQGGTAQTTWTLGDLLYSSASNTLAKLAGNTTSTKKYLSQTGTGSVSAAPAWAQVAAADISGLGTAATQNTGTSGANIPLLNAANTFSALETFSAGIAATQSITSANTIDASGQTAVSVTNGSSVAIAFSNMGFVFITDTNTGHTAFFGLISGGATLIWSDSNWVAGAAPSAGNSSVAWNGSAFAIYNNTGATHGYKVITLRTH
jgi:hypothetical protein